MRFWVENDDIQQMRNYCSTIWAKRFDFIGTYLKTFFLLTLIKSINFIINEVIFINSIFVLIGK